MSLAEGKYIGSQDSINGRRDTEPFIEDNPDTFENATAPEQTYLTQIEEDLPETQDKVLPMYMFKQDATKEFEDTFEEKNRKLRKIMSIGIKIWPL